MWELFEIILYVVTAMVVIFGVIPMMLYMWGSMFMRGVMKSYFEYLNKNKNGKKEEE